LDTKKVNIIFEKNFTHSKVHGNSPVSDIPYRRSALLLPHSGHCPNFVGSALAARGDYCRVPKKSGADPSNNQELIRRKPLTETQRHGENFSPGTLTSSLASATLSDDYTETPSNPMRQNAAANSCACWIQMRA